MYLSNISKPKNLITASLILVIFLFSLIIYVRFESTLGLSNLDRKVDTISGDISEIEKSYTNLNENLNEELFMDHVRLREIIRLEGELEALNIELETLRDTSSGSTFTRVNTLYAKYQAFQTQLKRNLDLKLKMEDTEEATKNWGQLLLDKEFDELESSIDEETKKVDDEYKKYLASLPPPPPPASSGDGYSFVNIDTERGTFGVYLVKVSKSSAKVRTIAAADSDCKKDCPTKSLADYANDNGAFAAMAGSYSCPADYASCADKKWSFDFALYDSGDGKWLNKGALTWGDTGLITFNGSSSSSYEKSSSYGGGGVTAGISNFPMLVSGGNIVVDSGDVDSFQSSKGTRGVLGTDDNNIYLAYVTRASVIDAAYAIRALGAKSALNLDGGGSAAMYVNGRYIVGPGRPLPNAVLLVR